ncbi:hypothetical protein [Spirochaeta africana]|uniref:Outer membrane protein beta-barrel domain-containing protein n=1 Tax=Spirochaeta africana (strain ATCC 700263 / DSM 8902 / Z-7692) TaxID=889378 RepID=H9UGS5_SPIAZ|nr:hypothetical protein [Spirochaeta africana]AFG36718.1 hypothetical protein Spiaf_0618 [Spirochaeta africana DSM 8902]
MNRIKCVLIAALPVLLAVTGCVTAGQDSAYPLPAGTVAFGVHGSLPLDRLADDSSLPNQRVIPALSTRVGLPHRLEFSTEIGYAGIGMHLKGGLLPLDSPVQITPIAGGYLLPEPSLNAGLLAGTRIIPGTELYGGLRVMERPLLWGDPVLQSSAGVHLLHDRMFSLQLAYTHLHLLGDPWLLIKKDAALISVGVLFHPNRVDWWRSVRFP